MSSHDTDHGPVRQRRKERPPLPVVGQPPTAERSDAARNRKRVLDAAKKLFDERGVAAVTLDDVVAAAGVGKGTLFRRFGDKAGLAVALLDEQERTLQEEILTGPPPLGPGASPVERLLAFVRAYVAYVADNTELVAMSQTSSPGARLRTGSHRFWRQHCEFLLASADAPDAGLRADILLAGLTAEQIGHWRHDQGWTPRRLANAVARTAEQLATH
ncbi:MAG TPA: TetR/AcrR family transcriptional regulator [Jatrophihabitantaceae bacterium]|nr:TetR/AcrR family transcriptional regulator [Jatrophihabitantaceae bacterium]